MSIEYHLKRRDAYQMLADAENEEIEKHAPAEPKPEPQPYNLMNVVTKQTQGSKGYYLRVNPEDNEGNRDYELFVEHLKKSGGKLTKQEYFCWLFSDNMTAGMKPISK